MRQIESKARFLVVLLGAMVMACATSGGPGGSFVATPVSPEAEAGAAFMQGHLLELRGHLPEAAEAYERAARADPESVELQLQLARVWARVGDPERAIEHANRAYELAPDDERTRGVLAALYVTANRYEEAVGLLEPEFRSGGLSEEGLFGLFNLYLQISDLEGAERVAWEMIARDPGDLRGYLALGTALESSERPEKAEEIYRRALKVVPDHPGTFDALARLRRGAGDQQGELEVLREKLVVVPGDPAALLRMAQLYDQQDDRETAIETLEALVSLHPNHVGAQFQLGIFYYQEDRHADAIVRLNRVIRESSKAQHFPLLYESQYFLGLVHYDAGEADEALEALRLVPSDSKRFPDARLLMARILEEQKRFPEALAEARRAALSDPENVTLQVSLAGFVQRSGDFEAAIEIVQGLVERHPDDPDLYYDLGLIYGEAGDEERVLEIMHQVLERDPNHANALNYIGYTWADKGVRLDEAERMIRRAVELRPNDGYITDSLGWVLYQRGLSLLAAGRVADAREALTNAVLQLERSAELLEKGDPVITRHLGDAYRSVSRFSDALDSYRRALGLDPKESDAEEIRRQIELLELQLKGASSGAQP
jgi:tetratricopeptide (TPR) repeat protein